jgi:hypothetical protein
MRDLLVVRCGHTFIMDHPEVIAQAFHFLAHGEFDRSPSALTPRAPGASLPPETPPSRT